METHIIDVTTTFNDIPHLATTLWYSGCKLDCVGCHNTILENFKTGMSIEKLSFELKKRRKMTDWIVHLGGNPLDSIESLLYVSTLCNELGYKQFLYSGYTYNEFESMFNKNIHEKLINNIDFIKTGRYDMNHLKSCYEAGKDYFFETLNQEVYKNNREELKWDKIYAFDFNQKNIYGSFAI